jgi:DNA-nicking Smr family endonuclease
MHFQIGEKVVFLREQGGGIIRKIEGDKIYIEDETGFDRPFRKADIAKIHGTNYTIPEDESVIQQLADENYLKQSNAPKIYSTHKDYWEIDLHFEDLVDVYGDNLRKQEDRALLKQMAIFKDFYYKARSKKIKKLIVIHGFGKGVLRDELHTFLKGQEGVDFLDASYIEYGHGATQIEIKYKY